MLFLEVNDKQKRFAEEYVVDMNGTAAAKRAGYSEKTSYSIQGQLLSKLEIQSAIAELKAKQSERTNITADNVLKELAKVAFANMKDYASWCEESGVKFNSSDAESVDGAVVSEISSVKSILKSDDEKFSTEKITLKVKLHDKIKALEMLGRHLRIFGDDSGMKPIKVNVKLPKEFAN